MGVVNVTPDSFSDGGQFCRPPTRSRTDGGSRPRARRSSTWAASRPGPGADAVDAEEELRRVVPVLEGLAGVPVSIDTSKAAVARRALELGAELVNDVTALRGDPALAGVVAEHDAYVCLMHMQGEPRTMQVGAALRRRRVRGRSPSSRSGSRLPSAAGIREESDLRRPGHRLRQDAGPEPRAHPAPRRLLALGRPGARRPLAQEHARQGAGRPGGDDGNARGLRRRAPWRLSSAGRGCSACTTSARPSRRSRSRRRSNVAR